MYTLYKFHFLNGISEINQLFDDILIIWPAPVYIEMFKSVPYMLFLYSVSYRFLIIFFWIFVVDKLTTYHINNQSEWFRFD